VYVEKLELIEPPVCPTCGEAAEGKYCAKCGEQIQLRPDYSFRGLIGETLNVVANLESNIFRSFAFLIAKPGLLTVEYFAGRRKRHLKPLQLFIFCNVIFFFVQAFAGFNSMRTPLQVHLYRMPYGRFARYKVGNELQKTGMSYTDYETRFNSNIETQAKTLIFLMIPMFAAGLALIYLGQKEYFVKHIVFATHFFAFYLLLLSLFYLVLEVTAKIIASLGGSPRSLFTDLFVTVIVLSVSFVYLLLAGRRAYPQPLLKAALRALTLIGVLAIAVQTFRFVLFFTAFYSV
jgi:hypothetical protein